MPFRTGLGQSKKFDAHAAGRQAAMRAREQLGEQRPDILLVFATVGYAQGDLLEAIGRVFPDVPVSGCSAEGVITQAGSDEGSHAVALMAIASSSATFKNFIANGFGEDATECGRMLANQINAANDGSGKLLLLFPDGLTANVTDLIRSVETNLNAPVLIAGGAAGEIMMDWNKTFQYHNTHVASNSVCAVLVSGPLEVASVVSHGCHPIGLGCQVTKADGAYVREIDDAPAWQVLKEYLDNDVTDLSGTDVGHLCIGAVLPPSLGQGYGDFLVRTVMGVDTDTGSLFIPGQIAEGTEIHFVRRDRQQIRSGAMAAASQLVADHGDTSPQLVLQFDCCSRGRAAFGDATERIVIDSLQERVGKSVPWLGFHCYGEIAPVAGKTYYHNLTVALCALYEAKAA